MKNPETSSLYLVGSGFDLASNCFDKYTMTRNQFEVLYMFSY
ncbi:hypothetical protein [Dysgonomonas mossii]|nr:hypothetical protein [Dysgonomonas mossii]